MFVCADCNVRGEKRAFERDRKVWKPEYETNVRDWYTYRPTSYGPCEICEKNKTCLVNG